MQAMDVSAGKGEISALATHPSNRILACGFNKGSIKVFQTGEKPKFLNSLQYENSSISFLEYSHCGNFLAIMHDNGYTIIVNSKFEAVVELEQSRNKPMLLFAMHESFSSHGMHLIAATVREDYLIGLNVFKVMREKLEKIDERTLEIEGNCTGIKFHCSGNYLFSSSNAGGIYIFNVESGDICGVILTERPILGCIVDPSGLYIGAFTESAPGLYTKFILYEIGTGKKASELGRLDNICYNATK